MKIVVCIKHVPDTTTVIKIAEDGRQIDPTGIKWVISPYDEYALEQAIQLKEQGKANEIIALCLGPNEAQATVRQALAMGADRGILLDSAEHAEADGAVRAKILAKALEVESPDLVLLGKLGVGMDEGELGGRLAVLLDRPHIGQITEFECSESGFTAERGVEGAVEKMQGSLPAVLSCDKGPREPRYPNLRGIMQAKKKPLEIKPVADLGLEPSALESKISVLSLDLPPAKSGCKTFEGSAREQVEQLVNALQTEAKVI